MNASLPVFLDGRYDTPIGRAEVDTEADTVTIVVKASHLRETIEMERDIIAGPFRAFSVSYEVQVVGRKSDG